MSESPQLEPPPGGDQPVPVASPLKARPTQPTASERQWKALSFFAIVACAVIAWIASPVGIGMLLGTLTAFALQPLYDVLVSRTRHPNLAAAACAVLAAVGIASGMSGLAYLLAARGAALAQSLLTSLGPDGPARAFFEQAASRLGPFQMSLQDLTTRLRDVASSMASRAAQAAGLVAQTALGGLLGLFFAVLTIYFVLRHWSLLERRAELMLPLERRHTHALFEEFRKVGRTTLLGTVVTGVVQGVFAAFGYWISGVPDAAFFGAATAVASLLPAVGTLLVWVPVGIFLLVTDHAARGILELTFGAFVVVGITDYVIRPKLVGGEGNLPALLTFASLFGGVEVFGLIGLILGPLLMSMAMALLRIYAKESAARRETAAQAGS